MDRRYFLSRLASGLVAAAAPGLFIPKLIKPQWSKVPWSGPRPKPVAMVDMAPPEREMSLLMSFRVVSTEDGKEVLQTEGIHTIAPMALKYTITPQGVIKTMEPSDEALLRRSPVKVFSLGQSKWSKREMSVQVQMVNNMDLSQINEATKQLLSKELDEAAGV